MKTIIQKQIKAFLQRFPTPARSEATRNQRGFVLVEMVMATVLLGGVVLVFLSTIATGSRAVSAVDSRIELDRIAQSQMEYTLSYPYLSAPVSYPSISVPSGYSVTASAEELQGTGPNIQRVIVDVYKNGELRRTLEAFKINQ